jgi:hypothetical protein
VANGFWAIDVARAGKYEVTLRQQPAVAKFVIPATTARLKVGEIDETRAILEGSTSVTFPVKLPAGKTRLQTWLTEKDGTTRGAYFVEMRWVE